MPPTPKIGSVVAGARGQYRLDKLINEGNMAWSLAAADIDHGDCRVFLKYYKSPTPKVSWYAAYVDYVSELNRRLEESDASRYCVLCRDLFVANPRPGRCPDEYFYQVFDFIEDGYDLRGLLEKNDTPWEKRKAIAKVFLVAMRKVHDARVVHCDLKPENVQMLPAPETKLGLIPRMIDMDRSILADKAAPWTSGPHKEGYTGTPGYMSPEHLRGEVPQMGSDIFTIALILGELLGGSHPFAAQLGDPAAYKAAVMSGGQYAPVKLLGKLGNSAEATAQFEQLLERCLAPAAAARPSCEELHRTLLQLDREGSAGTTPLPAAPATPPPASATPAAPTVPPAVPDAPVPPPPPAPPPAAPQLMALKLRGEAGAVSIRFAMDLGRASLANASAEARYAERDQFRVCPRGGAWYISPCPGQLRNYTAVNGEPLTAERQLAEGDTVCLMGRSSGRTAMHLTVSFC